MTERLQIQVAFDLANSPEASAALGATLLRLRNPDNPKTAVISGFRGKDTIWDLFLVEDINRQTVINLLAAKIPYVIVLDAPPA